MLDCLHQAYELNHSSLPKYCAYLTDGPCLHEICFIALEGKSAVRILELGVSQCMSAYAVIFADAQSRRTGQVRLQCLRKIGEVLLFQVRVDVVHRVPMFMDCKFVLWTVTQG